jgi:hypothetical protein
VVPAAASTAIGNIQVLNSKQSLHQIRSILRVFRAQPTPPNASLNEPIEDVPARNPSEPQPKTRLNHSCRDLS